jgi:hypothetical protein
MRQYRFASRAYSAPALFRAADGRKTANVLNQGRTATVMAKTWINLLRRVVAATTKAAEWKLTKSTTESKVVTMQRVMNLNPFPLRRQNDGNQ